MMIGISSSVKFVKKIRADFRMAELVDNEMPTLALMFETQVKSRTPRRQGILKAHMVGSRTGFLKAQVSNNVEYAPYVEYGIGSQTDWPGGTSHPEWAGFAPRAMMRNGAKAMLKLGLDYLKNKLRNTRL